MTLVPYVEFGPRVASPGPFESLGGTFETLVLEADAGKLDALVELVLNQPVGDAIEYRALGRHVLLMVGGFESVRSLAPGFSDWGTVREVQASFWVPVLAGHRRAGVFLGERLALFVPFIWVDNPMSYFGGREEYGYPKGAGRFTPATGHGEHVVLRSYGGRFTHASRAAWHPLLELRDAGPADGARDFVEGAAGLVAAVTKGLIDEARTGQGMQLAGLTVGAQVVDAILHGHAWQVALKQFRDTEDGTRACYQAVVEARYEITRVKVRRSARRRELVVHDMDSAPLAAELGLRTQVATVALEQELDFVLDVGEVIGP
ncbi:MAG TPA: acetoacetate decarboxylase family protein [Solirubrobacteraceae bacterium]